MNFKQAFENYRNNTATAEEALFVEAELEKSLLISEYLEEGLPQADSLDDAPAEDLHLVRRQLRRRNFLLVLSTILCVGLLAAAYYYVAVPLLNRLYYNPTTHTYETFSSDFDIAMTAVTELHSPGNIHSHSYVERTGIGSYSVTFAHYTPQGGNPEYISASLTRGQFDFPYAYRNSSFPINAFSGSTYPQYPLSESSIADINQRLAALPETVSVVAAVSFSEDPSLHHLLELLEGYNGLQLSVSWVGVRNAAADQQLLPMCGFEFTGSGSILENINQDYPAFELSLVEGTNGQRTAEDYAQHFKSLLAYLMDNPEFLRAYYGSDTDMETYYQDVLDYVAENGVNTYGIYVVATPQTLLSLYDTGLVSQIFPMDADIKI